MPQFDVFLSHSSVDKPWVIKLKDDLQRYGVAVWLDKDEIRPGDLFAKALGQGLASSRVVALIVSPASTASGWVEAEYYRALSLATTKKRPAQLIPVILHTAKVPAFLQDRKWVDFRDEAAYAHQVFELVWGITGEKPAEVLDLDSPNVPPAPLFISPAEKPGVFAGVPALPNEVVGRDALLAGLIRRLTAGNTLALSAQGLGAGPFSRRRAVGRAWPPRR